MQHRRGRGARGMQVMNLDVVVVAAGLQQLEGDWLVGCGSNDVHAGL